MTHLKATAAALALFCGFAIGAGLIAQQARTDQPARPATKALAPAVKALIEAERKTAEWIYEGEFHKIKADKIEVNPPSDDAPEWSRRWMDAELRLRPDPAARIAAITAHLDRMRELERAGETLSWSVSLRAKYHRLEAEQMLAEAESAVGDATPPTKVKPESAAPG